ncbi:MAG: flagella basal body P-ring formation protein FlgA [Rhodospirillales bacterium]|nr:MAG: flagella basal body P-ring formation protein FlgA [Rhodospirillales bacterium]
MMRTARYWLGAILLASVLIWPGRATANAEFAALAGSGPVLARDTVVVDGPLVRLGDLFHNAGANAGKAVAHAPSPGHSARFDARWLYRVASAHGLDWRPATIHAHVTVARDSIVIGRDDVEAAILEALAEHGVDSRAAAVQFSNRTMRFHLPTDADPELMVEDLSYDARRGRVHAVVAVDSAGQAAQRIRVHGQVEIMSEVPVLARNLRAGEVISARDVRWITQPRRSLQADAVLAAEDLVGMTARRGVRAGAPVMASDVRQPVVVGKGDLVTIVLQTSHMLLTARGRALQDGARGSAIRVSNAQSNQVVEAVVVGPGQVAVRPVTEYRLR